jgi:hypothetical protein
MTLADQAIREKVYRLHRGAESPKITFQIWAGEVGTHPVESELA